MMHERLDEQFMQSRFGVVNNMYQISLGYYGQYLGSTPGPYQDLHTPPTMFGILYYVIFVYNDAKILSFFARFFIPQKDSC